MKLMICPVENLLRLQLDTLNVFLKYTVSIVMNRSKQLMICPVENLLRLQLDTLNVFLEYKHCYE
jgi:hypothetical protein